MVFIRWCRVCLPPTLRWQGRRKIGKVAAASHVPFRLGIGIDERTRCEARRPNDGLGARILEFRQIGALDVLILDLKDTSLGPAAALAELDVADDGLEQSIARKLCELCIVKRARPRYRLFDNLHLGVSLRRDI